MKYTKEIIEEAVKNSNTYQDVLNKLGLKPSGGNHSHIKHLVQTWSISTDHFKQRPFNRGVRYTNLRVKPDHYLRVYDRSKVVSSCKIKQFLFRDNLKEKVCEVCGRTSWNDLEIPLELHHINGDHWDNRLENLMILCPNCHSQM